MAFNSRTYHANKYAREARQALAEARQYKAQGGSSDLVAASARYALALARLARIYRKPRP